MGVLLIKTGAWTKHPSSVGVTWDCRIKCIPKIEQVWTGFWQRTGQLDYLVQKLGACPGTGKLGNLSAFATLARGLEANNTAAELPGRLGAQCKKMALLISPFPQEGERLQVR